MKLFLGADHHGKSFEKLEDIDMILIVGDFAKGDKLREVVFGNGTMEDAKTEIIESSKKFLKDLPKNSIISPGNVEKLCIDKVSEIANQEGHYFLNNKIIDINGLKILGLKFFMEEEWAKNAYPNNKDKINRAREEEIEVTSFLNDNPDADIVLSHLPPYKILDKNTNPPKFLPKNYPEYCGSKILLDYIERNQPKLVVCGHIHVPGEEKVGDTVVINPGKKRIISVP